MNFIKNFKIINLPYILSISLIALVFLFARVDLFGKLSEIFLLGSTIGYFLAFTLCPISLIFQFRNKEKTKFDKCILIFNCIHSFFAVTIFLTIALWNPISDFNLKRQINAEKFTLAKEYAPTLNYLAQYKKQYGIYPDKIDETLPVSILFTKVEYDTSGNKQEYRLRVYPKKSHIEYYYTNRNNFGLREFEGDGYEDGFMGNMYYYEIDKNWHAIKYSFL